MLELGRDRSYVAQSLFSEVQRGGSDSPMERQAGTKSALSSSPSGGLAAPAATASAGRVGTLCPIGKVLVTDVYLSLCHCQKEKINSRKKKKKTCRHEDLDKKKKKKPLQFLCEGVYVRACLCPTPVPPVLWCFPEAPLSWPVGCGEPLRGGGRATGYPEGLPPGPPGQRPQAARAP